MGKKPVNPGFLQKKKYDFQYGKNHFMHISCHMGENLRLFPVT